MAHCWAMANRLKTSGLARAHFFVHRSKLRSTNGSRGSGGMLPWKVFEILHTVMVIFVLFEQFSGKFYLNILPLILRALTNCVFFAHFRLCVLIQGVGRRAYCCRIDSKLRNKNYLPVPKTFFKWAGGVDASSTCPPWISPC